MKKILIVTGLLLTTLIVAGQDMPNLKADSAAIIETALNYGDGWYSGDAVRMEKAIHPDLNKVCPVVLPQTGKTFLMLSTWSGLIEPARIKAGFLEEDKRNISVKVLKINDNVACAKLNSASFNDYLEMVKFEGQWKIVNVLWVFGPEAPNRQAWPDFNADKEKPAVDQAVVDMVEGMYSSDVPRLEKVIHPEFRRATAVLLPASGKTFIQREAASLMLELTRAKILAMDQEKWDYQVNILDVMEGAAFAELLTPSGPNYVQLAKIDGQWKIINMLRKGASRG